MVVNRLEICRLECSRFAPFLGALRCELEYDKIQSIGQRVSYSCGMHKLFTIPYIVV